MGANASGTYLQWCTIRFPFAHGNALPNLGDWLGATEQAIGINSRRWRGLAKLHRLFPATVESCFGSRGRP
ncbi:MAG: hypothetical protein CBB71_12140 [Rhodopirellula sp. TMED11]|nr:MAG: hypothetical protein CBB71_12140 [Rhodopirellula sp. TMED11]